MGEYEMDLKKIEWSDVDLIQQMAHSCTHDNEPLGSIK
jgi:hypothetical protein